jgi:mRNA (guanine-N7-)-methyltransferase
MNMLHEGRPEDRHIKSRDFVGFSSISLEMPNITPLNPDSDEPNIRNPYTVTEKADGIRKMLYINKDGKVYFIDVNMNVQFTGVVAGNQDYHESLIDGEHVLHDKYGAFINYYLAFDAYYIGREDIRSLALANGGGDETFSRTRIVELHNIVTKADFQPLIGAKLPLIIKEKTFYVSSGPQIFNNCNTILSNVADDLFEYETDGLIFTPANTGVSSDRVGEKLPPTKMTWKKSFKWKPPEFNTIDFLVTTKKTESGEDFIGNIFEDGTNMHDETQLTQYKTLVLRVGFSERNHGYLNPCEDIIQGHLPTKHTSYDRNRYKPVPFYPTDPTPKFPGYLCNVLLKRDRMNVDYMMTEDEKDTFTDGTIVEFRYQQDRDAGWQWIPIRVRRKKTAEYRAGKNNFGNAYHVANSVWRSIHNPITETMIRSGANIPSELVEDDVYYNRKSESTITQALRDFHNLFVKRILILSVANRGDILIDMTVGKGGDFPKWIAAKLSFVFGMDISRDNIQNRMNGACARFLNYRKKWKTMPMALFVSGNSALNIRGQGNLACFTDKGKQITRAVFGEGPKDEAKLGAGVYKQYGKGRDGFHIVSNQFSIHYFFENKTTLNGFLRNVSECCKVGGYFIGTSYDGTKVFRALESKKPGESIKIMHDGKKMWEITKQYDNDSFDNNESCLGYQIDVYQETINKVFPEYLVNYEYLIRLMEQYGFALLTAKESQEIGMPSSIDNVNVLFTEMKHRIKSRRLRPADIGTALNMTPDEKKVSFLNKYFILKKIRDVNAEEVEKIQLNISEEAQKEVSKTNEALAEVVETAQADKPKVKKLKKKMRLKKATKATTAKPKMRIKRPRIKIKTPTKDDE